MKQSINFSAFHDAFRDHDRLDNFSYEGLRALFDYFEQYEDDTGEAVELDVIGICCEYTEDDWEFIADNYSIDMSDCDDDDDREQTVEEYLSENTQLIGMLDSGSIVYLSF